jgi:hypothetical protein
MHVIVLQSSVLPLWRHSVCLALSIVQLLHPASLVTWAPARESRFTPRAWVTTSARSHELVNRHGKHNMATALLETDDDMGKSSCESDGPRIRYAPDAHGRRPRDGNSNESLRAPSNRTMLNAPNADARPGVDPGVPGLGCQPKNRHIERFSARILLDAGSDI